MAMVDVQEVARRIQIDFIEWPMLRVTLPQACRLWSAVPRLCEEALLTLVRAEFLLDRDGMFSSPGPRRHLRGRLTRVRAGRCRLRRPTWRSRARGRRRPT